MRFNEHWGMKGKHAFLSPSMYHWVNYDEDHLAQSWETHKAAELGTRLHALAAEHIELGLKMPRTKKTFNMYVNDGISYRMVPEQMLYYSDNCFGTADTISFKNGLLRIHDLKTGVHPAKFTQLEVYAALFCMEYDVPPGEIGIELHIYQNNEVMIEEPDIDQIAHIMDQIVHFDAMIENWKANE